LCLLEGVLYLCTCIQKIVNIRITNTELFYERFYLIVTNEFELYVSLRNDAYSMLNNLNFEGGARLSYFLQALMPLEKFIFIPHPLQVLYFLQIRKSS